MDSKLKEISKVINRTESQIFALDKTPEKIDTVIMAVKANAYERIRMIVKNQDSLEAMP